MHRNLILQKLRFRPKELDEIVVKASYLTREDDHILAIPTKEQRKHAVTGYDLLNNLMIPGVSVERSTGSVTTPSGAATLYIDGRKVDFREVQSLRPRILLVWIFLMCRPVNMPKTHTL